MHKPACLFTLLFISPAMAVEYPDTRRDDTVDTFHGEEVEDPFRWLENWSSEEVKAWSAAQNAVARKMLDALPGRDEIGRRVDEVTVGNTVSYSSAQRVGEKAWFMKYAPPRQQPSLVEVDADGNADSVRMVFDPESADSSGSTSVEWYKVSPNGKYVAIALTTAGTEIADLHIFDATTGLPVDEVLPRVNGPTAGGDMSWDTDSTGFFYTRYPRDGEKSAVDQNFYQQLWHRELGTALAEDSYELGSDFDRIAEIRIDEHPGSGKLLATMQYGDSGRFQLYVRDSGGAWHQVSKYDDQLVQAIFLDENALLVLSRNEAPRGKFMVMDISMLPATGLNLLIPETEDTFASNFYGDPTFVIHYEKLYVKTLVGGPAQLRIYDLQGQALKGPELGVAGVGQIEPWGDGVLLRHYSYKAPNKWLFIGDDPATTHPLSSTSSVNFDGYKVIREFATSRDGTRIPVNIMLSENARLDGSNPLLLTGYGGYGISLSPGFNPARKIWLEQGGIFAVANLRGGGEYGEEWHEQGMLTNKQNVFDDFHAVMKHLVERGYTSVDQLVIEGGSNGGLLMGAMITQHPGDFRAVVSHVGVYDSLRSELSPNGAFNIPEYGTVENPDHFKALRGYSPYHNVRKNSYPSILFMSGANDGRVDPMHSRKMTAALQTANTSDKPVILRTSENTGHGAGTPLSESIAKQVDRLSFIFSSLGMEYRPVVR